MKDFRELTIAIELLHTHLQTRAVNAVNQALTIRNWLIGYYIVEFELYGEDRAKYGEALVDNLADSLQHIKGIDRRSLFRYRKFYLVYSQIRETLTHPSEPILGSMTQELINVLKVGTVSPLLPESVKVGTLSPQSGVLLQVPGNKIIEKLSYSHIELILNIEDSLKRTFYEIECIKGTWSVRELKRQINSLYFERSGLSSNPEKLSELVNFSNTPQHPVDIVKNIYAFEFLNLDTKELVEESDLETALLDHLQLFILELGNGFCFEARQKRILIGENYYFVDLVFYHRILKCHVLVDLKIGAFEHGDIGQLNTYLNYFKEEISEESDNHPVGILLVAEKDHALVKYATAGMDQNLFVQQYLIQLPSTDQLKKYLEKELKEWK